MFILIVKHFSPSLIFSSAILVSLFAIVFFGGIILKVIGIIGLLFLMVRYFSSFIVVSGVILVLLISIGFVGGIFETVSDFIKDDNRDYRDSEERYGDYEEGYTDDNNTHHVDPHYVEGYERSDGTVVEGYWRGGEDGYERSDPDGSLLNNLK